MLPFRPYLLQAFYKWIVANDLTPYIMVNAEFPNVSVPTNYIENGKIILNISPDAVNDLKLGLRAVEFDASFSGKIHHIYVPIQAIEAIYAHENANHGTIFSEEDFDILEDEDGNGDGDGTPPKGPPHLTLVK